MKQSDTTVLLGSSGMLGQDLLDSCRNLNGSKLTTFADRDALDLSDTDRLTETIRRIHPGIIINAAAFTDVDEAEHLRDESERVNHNGVASLAQIAREIDALLVHFSTNYIFNGRSFRSYLPDDEADPLNWYGQTKYRGETAIRQSGCRHLIIRCSWLFAAHGENFVKAVLRAAQTQELIEVATDQRGRPTSTRDLAEFTRRLILHGATGTYHVTNVGDCSRFELAQAILDFAGSSCRLVPVNSSDLNTSALRPCFSVLDISRVTQDIGHPRHWRVALQECVSDLLEDNADNDGFASHVLSISGR